MGLFQEKEGDVAIVVENGVYKQVPVYVRDGYIYAKVNGGFVRIMADGATTKAKMRVDNLLWEGELARDNLGRLCTPDAPGAKSLPEPVAQKLLGAAE